MVIRRLLFVNILFLTSVTRVPAQETVAGRATVPLRVSTQDLIRATIQFLASDEVADRAAGSVGADVAAAFIAAQFRLLGLQPAGAGGSFVRRVDAVAVASEGVLVVGGAGRTESVPVGQGLVAWPTGPTESMTIDGEIVFAGYGIHAPEFGWDDFGDASLHGRVIIVLPGDPGLSDSTRFRGSTGTSYGTLAYKLDEAARRGARGLIVLHDDVRSGASWTRIRALRSGDVLLPVGRAPQELAFAAIMQLDMFRRLLIGLGRDADVLIRRSELPSFQPIPVGAHAVMRLRSRVRQIRLLTIIGRIPGREERSGEEAVLITSPYDQGMVGATSPDGSVSSTVGDAFGVAVMLGAAGALLSPTVPERSIYVAAVAGSDFGNLAASELAANPPVPAERVTAVLNVDGPSVHGFPPAVTGIDAGEAGIAPLFSAAAVKSGVSLSEWTGHPRERFGLDHTPFAMVGIPSITLRGAPAVAHGDSLRYIEGLALQAGFVASLAKLLADAADRPAWNAESPYRAAWDRLERRRVRGTVP